MKAKSCLKEAVAKHCTFDADAREILQSAFDEYNPFCNVSTEEESKGSYHFLFYRVCSSLACFFFALKA